MPQSHGASFVRRLPTSTPLASIGLRCGAFLLDYILMLLIPAITLSLAMLFKRGLPGVSYFILFMGYLSAFALVLFNWVYLPVRDGQSLGQRLIGIRIVREDGTLITYKTAALRHLLGYPLAILIAGLGVIWMLFDARQQGWHDKIAGTLVVKD
ncbi:MAG TPA: RDD family protein [Blastocatellia bacterium]|nr:RDD family protein [Blastocatellia bacterium]